MLQNVIKNLKQKSLTLKLIFGSEKEAIDSEEMFSNHIDCRHVDIEKMQVAFGLVEVKAYAVFNSVFVQYEFESNKEAKNFEHALGDLLQEDNANIYDVFLIVAPVTREYKEESPYKIILKLPKEAELVLEHKAIKSLKIHGVEACEITREMAMNNGKEVELVDDDINSEYLNVIVTFNGKHKVLIPQKWLDIEEKTIKAIVNTKWMLELENLVNINNNQVIAKKGGKEIVSSLDVIKTDGSEVVLVKNDDRYVDIKRRDFTYTKEMLIIKAAS